LLLLATVGSAQRQIGRVERIALDIGQRRRLFDLPSRAPE
jgi:hypothetical protein